MKSKEWISDEVTLGFNQASFLQPQLRPIFTLHKTVLKRGDTIFIFFINVPATYKA